MSTAVGITKAQRLLIVAAMLCVTAIAAHLHSGSMHDVIAWDEANYTIAAKRGIIANAFELGELSQLRHRHAPLMCYAITASTAIFGNDEWSIRLPAVIACALSCGLLVLIGFDLARGSPFAMRLLAGLGAGLLLATSPASIELAGVIQPHSFVVLFLLLCLWTLCRYLRDLHRRDAILFGLSLAGQFVVMEYGPVILAFALVAVAVARPELIFGEGFTFTRAMLVPRTLLRTMAGIFRTVHRDIKLAAAACLAATAALWPAGVFLLAIPFNFVFFLLYAANGHPVLFRGEMHLHVPKYAYAYWYWSAHPLLLVGMIAAMVLILIWAWRDRRSVALTLAVFTLGLTASVHGAHIMQLCKSIFMIPPLALGGPLAVVALMRAAGTNTATSASTSTSTASSHHTSPRGFSLASWLPWAAALLLITAILGGQTTPMSRADDPNQRLVEMAKTLAAQAAPGDRILAQGWPMVSYMLHMKLGRPDLKVERYDPRNYTIDQLGRRIGENEFTWAMTIGPTTAANPDCPVLTELRSSWRIVDDQSLKQREYRLYRSPAVASTDIATDGSGQGHSGHSPAAAAAGPITASASSTAEKVSP